MKAPGIHAKYRGFIPVPGQGVVIFKFAVDADDADAAAALLGGFYKPDQPIFVGIARVPEGARIQDVSVPAAVPTGSSSAAVKAAERSPPPPRGLSADPSKPLPRKWDKISFPEQAGIRCQDPDFVKFLRKLRGWNDEPKRYVHRYCDVKSRADIKIGTQAATLWQILDADFLENRPRLDMVNA